MFYLLDAGGGAMHASDNPNTRLSSARAEAMGVAAGMSRCRTWSGTVTWTLDNEGVTKTWRKTGRLSALEWIRQSDRDIYGYMRAFF